MRLALAAGPAANAASYVERAERSAPGGANDDAGEHRFPFQLSNKATKVKMLGMSIDCDCPEDHAITGSDSQATTAPHIDLLGSSDRDETTLANL
jgi:hypothetical protein